MKQPKQHKFVCPFDGYREYSIDKDKYDNFINNKLIQYDKNRVYCYCK